MHRDVQRDEWMVAGEMHAHGWFAWECEGQISMGAARWIARLGVEHVPL